MNRSLWPEGVEIHQIDLVRNTQDTDDAIANRFTSNSTMGVASGLSVTPSPYDTTKLVISNGSGYTPNGQLVAVPVSQNNIALADPSSGAVNYVLAVYTEIYTAPMAHEDLGTTLPTAAVGSFRIAVLTAAQWNVLPTTDPNLNNNSRDRSVVLAIVTGTGGVLTQGNITSPPAYPPVYYVSQPSSISGVYVNSVSPNTTAGTGTLTYTIVLGTPYLQWTAPGDTIGPTVTVNANGTYTLVSGSISTAYTLTVTVTLIDLPSAPSLITNNLQVSSIYAQQVPRLSAIDDSHRHMLGSGVPSSTNPHALTLADIGVDIGGVIQQHQVEMHANGIVNDGIPPASRSLLQMSVSSGSAINDTLLVNNFITGDVAYVNGVRKTSLAVVGQFSVSFDDVLANYIELYGLYMEVNGTITKRQRMIINPPPNGGEVPPTPDPFTGWIQPVDVSDYSSAFDANIDLFIAWDNGTQMLGLGGGPNPIIMVPITFRDANNLIKLPYNTQPTPVAAGNCTDFIQVWLDPTFVASAPGVLSRSVPVRIIAKPPATVSFLIGYVCSQGKPSANSPATTMLGWGAYGNLGVNRLHHTTSPLYGNDRRVFGTLSEYDLQEQSVDATKIKNLSQQQVFNAISYTPYDGVTNPRPFALNNNAPGANSTNSHVVYADVAGSGGTTTTWNALVATATVPSALAGMTGGNAFNEQLWINNNYLNFSESFGIKWGASQVIFGQPTGELVVSGQNLFWVTSPARISGALDLDGSYGSGNVNLPPNDIYTVTHVRDPVAPLEAANKQYVDSVSARMGGITTAWVGANPTHISSSPYLLSEIKTLTRGGIWKVSFIITSVIYMNIGGGDTINWRASWGTTNGGPWNVGYTHTIGGGNTGYPVTFLGGGQMTTPPGGELYLRLEFYTSGPQIDMYVTSITWDTHGGIWA